jgi:hypothetical protein
LKEDREENTEEHINGPIEICSKVEITIIDSDINNSYRIGIKGGEIGHTFLVGLRNYRRKSSICHPSYNPYLFLLFFLYFCVFVHLRFHVTI